MADLITYQGGKFAQRGYDMYREVERITTGFDFFVVQGGYNVDGVAASAGTHDKEAVDVGASLLTPDQRWTVVTNMRRVGFAAWIRTPAQGFSWHVHGVPVNGDLSTAARAQVVQYTQKKNGLAGGGPDDGPPGYYDMTWEKYKGNSAYRPPIDTGGTGSTDWFDMATKDELRQVVNEEVAKVLRAEGVSGAADLSTNQRADGSWPTGAKILALVTRAVTDVSRTEGYSGANGRLEAIKAKLGIS